MSWVKKHRHDLLIILAILLYSLMVWWPTRELPYHWDSAGFVINSARTLMINNFDPLIVPDSDFAHPPLLMALLALSWKLFGQSQLVSHLLMFPFLPLLLISTYYLWKKLHHYQTGPLITALIAVTPVVIAEYGMIYIDLPLAAFTTAGLAAWIYDKRIVTAILLGCATLIKFPAIIIVLLLILWQVRKKEYYKAIPLIFPLLLFGLWLLYHYRIEGWWIARPNRLFNNQITLNYLLKSTRFVLTKLAFVQGRIYLTLSGLVALGYLWYRNSLPKRKIYLLIGILLVGSLPLFIYTGEFGVRYGIFLLPLLYGICASAIFEVLKLHKLEKFYLGVGLVYVIPMFLFWHPKLEPTEQFDFTPTSDLSYQDMISIGVQASQFLQNRYPQALIYGGFPESYQLTQPYQGYVSKPLQFAQCDSFTPNPKQQQIILFHGYSPIQLHCQRILQTNPTTLLARFMENGKWLQLLLVNASESAKLTPTAPN